jgi:hypothetical protein
VWRRGVAGLLMLLTAGCGAGWRSVPPSRADQLPPRQQAQVWSAGEVRRWHALRIAADTVSGVPYLEPPDCDSCRVALPLSGVDSIRTGDPVRGFLRTTGAVFVGGLLLVILYCGGVACTGGT